MGCGILAGTGPDCNPLGGGLDRLDPETGARWMANYLKALTMELTALARACGKSNVHHLEPDDLVALTIEAAAMARVPLAGTDWIPGRGTG